VEFQDGEILGFEGRLLRKILWFPPKPAILISWINISLNIVDGRRSMEEENG
jgi:hypothetical protein